MLGKIHDKPKMDIKTNDGGVSFELDYSGKIVIITKDEHSRLVARAKEFDKVLDEMCKDVNEMMLQHQREVNRLEQEKRQLEEQLKQAKAKTMRGQTEAERQRNRAEALLNRQGQGRPVLLTAKHKAYIEANKEYLKIFGGKMTAKDMEGELVHRQGYAGGYEPVAKYIRELKRADSEHLQVSEQLRQVQVQADTEPPANVLETMGVDLKDLGF